MNKFRVHKRQLILILVGLLIFLAIFLTLNLSSSDEEKGYFYQSLHLSSSLRSSSSSSISSSKLYRPVYKKNREWFLTNCLKGLDAQDMSLESLDVYIQTFQDSQLEHCRKIAFIFKSMFELEVQYGEIRIESEAFRNKVKKWLDNKQEYLDQAYKQKVIKLFNKFYHDEMIYNGLRGKRPQPKPTSSEKNYTFNLLRESEADCDFCNENYKTNTANEIFDRLESNLSYTAANTFKYDKWHSLIISRNHNTLFLTEEEIVDIFNLSLKWFEKVNSINSKATYPELIWDAMPKSGASQVHTHLQSSMGEQAYYGMMRRWLYASARYFRDNSHDFLQDFVLLHRALGLTYELNDVSVIVNLIPLKDLEIMIVAKNEAYPEHSRMVHKVIRVFVDKLEQFSFSAGMYLPEFGSPESAQYSALQLRMIYTRILFRSPVTILRSDFNGLDFYTSSVIALDRFKLAHRVFSELKNMES